MRFSYAETFCDPTFLAPLAQATEDAGYDSFVVPDSLIFPAASDTLYPYTADGDRAFLEDKPIIEPFTLIPYLAARTNRIRFTTFVLKLAVRPVVLVAKQAASIAVLCDDRLRLGVGISPWPEDFAAMDVPWERRGHAHGRDGRRAARAHGRRLVRVPRRGAAARALQDLPHSRAADPDPRSAVTPTSRCGAPRERRRLDPRGRRPGRAREHGAAVHALRAEYGRAASRSRFTRSRSTRSRFDGVRRLEDLGVTDAIVGFRYPYTTEPDTQPLQEKIDLLRRFADRVIR